MLIAFIGLIVVLTALSGFGICGCLLFTNKERAAVYAWFILKLLLIGIITWIYGNIVFQFN